MAPAGHRWALLSDATADQLGVRRFAQNNAGLWPFTPQHARNAGDGSAGPIAGHKGVQALAGKVIDDFPGVVLVDVGVGLGLELSREPAVVSASSPSGMPSPFCARGVSATLLQHAHEFRRSTEKLSAIVTTSG
jgi:hypothetical protein